MKTEFVIDGSASVTFRVRKHPDRTGQ